MTGSSGSAPAWLFSFVDLAFLLLIAMTQLGADGRAGVPELGEIAVPRIGAETAGSLPSDARERWQLRVHPPGTDRPFELARDGADGERLPASDLRGELAALRETRAPRPILAPHEESRSGDMLAAVALVDELWAGRRRATIIPDLEVAP